MVKTNPTSFHCQLRLFPSDRNIILGLGSREKDFVINSGCVAQHLQAYLPVVVWLSLHSLCCNSARGPQTNANWPQYVLVLETFL